MKTTLNIEKMAKESKKASFELAQASSLQKNKALEAIAKGLLKNRNQILSANLKDISDAKKKGLDRSLIDRLSLENRIEGIVTDIEKVIILPDPIGEQFESIVLPNGLEVSKCRTPIGVIGIIYESRPNVTIDVSAIAIKTGNCAILRGGSETLRTNKALVEIIQKALLSVKLPINAIQLVSDSSREHVKTLLRLHQYIDMIIPRGGASLHQFCREKSTIPVITGGIGICHLFVDASADLDRSLQVIINAKTQRPTVCNALDTLLVHRLHSKKFILLLIQKLESLGVKIILDTKTWNSLPKKDRGMARKEKQNDWDTEWLSLKLGIKVVNDIDEALKHIQEHSTAHSDGILTQEIAHSNRFLKEIDSAVVYVNASTRFTDGSQLGLGAEVAISTQKLHARGPMGLKEMTTYKWIVKGDYNIRT
jgi:glutamate-5-semialdehyde dehydrogenase